MISLDTEITGLNVIHRDRPFIVSTFSDDEVARLWRWDIDPFTRLPNVPERDRKSIAKYLWHQDIVFHNPIIDCRALASIGLVLHFSTPQCVFPPGNIHPMYPVIRVQCGELHDTQTYSHAVNSTGANGLHRLKELSLQYLDYNDDDERELHAATIAARRIGKKLHWALGRALNGAKAPLSDYWMPRACYDWAQAHPREAEQLNIEVPDEWKDVAARYSIGDAERTLGMFYFLNGMGEDEPALKDNYLREVRLLPVTYRMEDAGMYVSERRLTTELFRFSTKAAEKKTEAEKIIKRKHKLEVNVNSGEQLVTWLNKSGIYPGRYMKGATDAPALRNYAQYAEHHGNGHSDDAKVLRLLVGFDPEKDDDVDEPAPGYRTFISATRFLNFYKAHRLDRTECFHPSYNQSGTKFTRYSSEGAQNVSKKAVIPLRRVFGPRPGYDWLAIDYSQVELRIFATIAKDQSMLDAFARGWDFHKFTASRMFDIEIDKVNTEQKRYAKGVNFKSIYGGINNVPKEYAAQFPRAASFMREVEAQVQEHGYINTLQGDRIYIPREKAYVGVDAIVQGTAGRIVKDAMQDIHDLGLVDWHDDGSKIVANIHDEIIFELPTAYPTKSIARRIARVMVEAGARYEVETPVEVSIIRDGGNWAAPEILELAA